MCPSFETVEQEVGLRYLCQTFLAPVACLLEKESLSDAMQDEKIRQYFGNTLMHEVLSFDEVKKSDDAIILMCKMLEDSAVAPLTDTLLETCIFDFKTYLFKHLNVDNKGLIFSLACLVMIFSNTKKTQGVYTVIGAQKKEVPLQKDHEALLAFSKLSCDMPSESLAYAVIYDTALWEKSLDDKEEVAHLLSKYIFDLQIIGPQQALFTFNKNKY